MQTNRYLLALGVTLGFLFLVITGYKWFRTPKPDSHIMTTQSGGYDPAIQEFWQAYRKATEYRLQGQTQQAIQWYAHALTLKSDHADALYYKGLMHWIAREDSLAMQTWRRLVRCVPLASRGWMQLGRLTLCRPESEYYQPDSSFTFFRKAHHLNPEESGPLFYMGFTSILQQKYDKAAEYLEAVVKFDSSNRIAALLLAYSYAQMNDSEALEKQVLALTSLYNEDSKPSDFELEGVNDFTQKVSLEHPLINFLKTTLQYAEQPIDVEGILMKLTTQVHRQ